MAGINRLGKGVLGKPGRVVHAPDLNRNRTLDFFSEETGKLESDRDYQRTVQDIEDAAQTQGWLFSRGAFDKTDLLYLRDAEEKSRHTEMELHDKEVMDYARLRLQNDKRKPISSLLGSVAKKTDRSGRQPGRPIPGKPIITISKAPAGGSSSAAAPRHIASASQQEQQARGKPQQQQQQQRLQAQTASPVQAEAPTAGLGDLLGGYGTDSDGSNGGSDGNGDAACSPPRAISSERRGTE